MNESLQRGLALLKAGRRGEALTYLAAAAREDSTNPQAWLGLAAALDDADKQRDCLQRALALQPDFQPAKSMLARLDAKSIVPSAPKPGAPSGAGDVPATNTQGTPFPTGTSTGAGSQTVPKPGAPSGVDGSPAAAAQKIPSVEAAASTEPASIPAAVHPIGEWSALRDTASKPPAAVRPVRKRGLLVVLLVLLLLACAACLFTVLNSGILQF